jgi:hypothetical protein
MITITFLLAMAGLFGALQSSAMRPDNSVGCQFAIRPETRAPEIRGAGETTARTVVMNQPGSPVAVLAVDLTGMNLFVGSRYFERSGRYSVTIKNISDRVLNRVDVMVHIWAYDGGIGDGAAWPKPLEPGATAVINVQSGRGSGTAPADDVQVVVVVNSAEMAGCRYKPSQQWPTFQRLSQ